LLRQDLKRPPQLTQAVIPDIIKLILRIPAENPAVVVDQAGLISSQVQSAKAVEDCRPAIVDMPKTLVK